MSGVAVDVMDECDGIVEIPTFGAKNRWGKGLVSLCTIAWGVSGFGGVGD